MRTRRTFLTRCGEDRYWLIEETWCDSCGEVDLGLDQPVESEERGVRAIIGKCATCGGAVRCDVVEIAFDDRPPELNAPRPRSGRGRPRRRAAPKAR